MGVLGLFKRVLFIIWLFIGLLPAIAIFPLVLRYNFYLNYTKLKTFLTD